jgi:hypothetical protein
MSRIDRNEARIKIENIVFGQLGTFGIIIIKNFSF